jgi:Polyketide cyclase / dehydrase and lipid transport
MTESPPLTPSNAVLQIPLGALVANAVGGVLLAIINWFVRANLQQDISTLVVWPSFFLLPFLIGLLAAWFWRRLNRTLGWSFLDALWVTLLGLVAAAVVLREGAVCIMIVSPALYLFILCGVLLGRIWFRPNYSNLQLTIFPLLALITLGELVYHSERKQIVTDRIVINAPPAKVWPHVLAFPEIPDPPDYWIFRLGLPYPTTTTNGGNFVGANRDCIFSNGVVIKERVAELVPNERLTFDVAEQPRDPEAYGHITLHRGQFLLQDNHDGTTTLIGSSWYTLHVRPRWYFDLWTRDMARAVHLRVMKHVKRLSEQAFQETRARTF